MAITFEEEKKNVNIGSILFIAALAIILFGGGYYIFFKSPDIISVDSPERIREINQISRLEVEPESILQSPVFQSFRDYRTPLTIPQTGRSNPFLPF